MKEKYKKIIQSIKSFFTHDELKKNTHKATHDWLISLSVAVVSAVMFCGAGVAVFFFFRNPPSETEIQTQYQRTFSIETLNELVDTYREQTKTYNTLRTTRPTIPLTGVETKPTPSEPEDDTEELPQEDEDFDDTEPFIQ